MTVRALALAAMSWGCASPPDANACESVVSVGCEDGGTIGHVDDASGQWVSGDWGGPHVAYPAFTTLRVCHGLGRVPTSVEVYASFRREGGIVAPQVGNVASVIASCNGQPGVTRESVLVRNGGGQDFYARFVLR